MRQTNEIEEVNMTNSYLEYLKNSVRNETSGNYDILLNRLHQIDFYSSIQNDVNRENDAFELRASFALENDLNVFTLEILGKKNYLPSVLEILISIASRMDLYLERDNNVSDWFWELVDNLGLLQLYDDNYVEVGGDVKLHKIIDKWLERRYKQNGKGGIFPLKKWSKYHKYDNDQRIVELWLQMTSYIHEKSEEIQEQKE